MAHRARAAVIIVILLAAGTWAGVRYLRRAPVRTDVLFASGTIEAEQVSIASKIPGRIEQIGVAEGDAVRAGTVLVTIEGRELRAQMDQARAAIAAAQGRVTQAQLAVRLQRSQHASSVAQAQAAVDAARARVRQAQHAGTQTADQFSQSVAQAEAALAAAQAASRTAQVNLDHTTRDFARVEALHKEGAVSAQQLDAARAARDAARAQYDASRDAVAQAEASVRLVRAARQQVGIRAEEVSAAQAAQRQADAALDAARAGTDAVAQRQADVVVAQASVAQAEASLRVLLEQEKNLTIASPIDGVVVTRHARAGEVIGAGAPILTVANLDQVWIRVFIPLPELGRVALGQRVDIASDAFPGKTFVGAVAEVSQQAEFTPRNVQTQEERVKLVFAVKVTVENLDHLLKPGMPADATIYTRSSGFHGVMA
ncbi:MAG TPA: efflux RND transporter periplasmic adaptor subunit [bacterium]|nr:efflux RND transporter periplasmic adaptor subunit [bacterium]